MSGPIRFPGRRLAAVLVALAAVGTACTNDQPGGQAIATGSSTTRPPRPTPPDNGLRPVRLVYGDGIAHVLPETAAQMICGALPKAAWREAMGGDVGRTVSGSAAEGKCVVTSGSLEVELQMTQFDVDSILAEDESIAGRTVRLRPTPSPRVASAAAAVVPLGEQDVPTQQRIVAYPVLYVNARVEHLDTGPDLIALLRRLLAALLPKLTTNGPPTPTEVIPQRLTYTPTEPVAGVALYDLPRTVQSLVLCTAVLKVSSIAPQADNLLVNAVGECSISRPSILAKIDPFANPVESQFTVAGHPAQISSLGVEIDLLTMTTEYDRTTHVALRLNRHYSDPAQLRPWAEKVATQLFPAA